MRIATLWVLIFGLSLGLQAQRKLRYNADSLSFMRVNKENINYLIGNVIFKQETTTGYCDSAIYNRTTNLLEAFRNVKIIDDSTEIISRQLEYDGNSRTAKLRGNVEYERNKRQLFTDYLEYDLESEIASYYSGGKLVDTTNTLTSKIGKYFGKTEVAVFWKDVVLEAPTFTLHTDTLRYNTVTKIAYSDGLTYIINEDSTITYSNGGVFKTEIKQTEFIDGNIETKSYILDGDNLFFDDLKKYYQAKGNVELVAKERDVIIVGEEGYYDRENGFSKIYGNPIMKRILREDTFYIAADTMVAIESDIDSARRILAYPDIRVFKTNLQGIADSAAYFLSDSLIYMYESPILWTEENQIQADTIIMKISETELEQINLIDNAFLISMDTLKNHNQIKGRSMIVSFYQNNLNKVSVNGNCESIFFSLDEGDSTLLGMNRLLCSNMMIRFKNNEIANFSIYKNPEGRFIPPHEIKAEDAKLEGFLWLGEFRPMLTDIYTKRDLTALKRVPENVPEDRKEDYLKKIREGKN
ncbi:MAG: Organic solvent tolerance protein OstA [Cyclobacteriaceae bacterium]